MTAERGFPPALDELVEDVRDVANRRASVRLSASEVREQARLRRRVRQGVTVVGAGAVGVIALVAVAVLLTLGGMRGASGGVAPAGGSVPTVATDTGPAPSGASPAGQSEVPSFATGSMTPGSNPDVTGSIGSISSSQTG
jgi:hypothetical protein